LTTTSLPQPSPEAIATRTPYVERRCFLGLPDYIRYDDVVPHVHFLGTVDQQRYGTPAVHGLPDGGNFLQRVDAFKAFWTWWWAAPRCGTCRLPIRLHAVGGPERAAAGRPVLADRAGSNRLAHARLKGLARKVETAPQGTRNHTLNACSLLAFRELSNHYTDDVIVDVMLQAALNAGLTHREAVGSGSTGTIGSARSSADRLGRVA
jgi:hypothetical protein